MHYTAKTIRIQGINSRCSLCGPTLLLCLKFKTNVIRSEHNHSFAPALQNGCRSLSIQMLKCNPLVSFGKYYFF